MSNSRMIDDDFNIRRYINNRYESLVFVIGHIPKTKLHKKRGVILKRVGYSKVLVKGLIIAFEIAGLPNDIVQHDENHFVYRNLRIGSRSM